MPGRFKYFPLLFLLACTQPKEISRENRVNQLAEQYLRLGLQIGQYDNDFVDAYYGPDSLRPTGNKSAGFPADSFVKAVRVLTDDLQKLVPVQDSIAQRANWMVQQLKAFERRVKLFSGVHADFDEESLALFGAKAPVYPLDHFKQLLEKLDSILPGKGEVSRRFNLLANRFVIPVDKLDTVFKTAIRTARNLTIARYQLPPGENFTIEFVKNKPWSGYNWYKGHYQSVIQINTDLPIMIERAVDLACHEGYPGHHVYNVLLEKKLYLDMGIIEISLYPVFSPQSLIAEGSANFGIEVAFPGDEQGRFIRNQLLPLAALDTTGITIYLQALHLKRDLNFVRNEVARGLLNGTMEEATAIDWLVRYGLYDKASAAKSIVFIKKYRSYVINYNFGQELVKQYVNKNGGTISAPDTRWKVFGWLLSNQVTTADLTK